MVSTEKQTANQHNMNKSLDDFVLAYHHLASLRRKPGVIKKPDFIGVGAGRCGTTTTYEMLKTHPSIMLSRVKDFMNRSNSVLVKHSSYTLEQTEGPYISGTVWADPDVNDCREQVESLIIDNIARKKLAHNAISMAEKFLFPSSFISTSSLYLKFSGFQNFIN